MPENEKEKQYFYNSKNGAMIFNEIYEDKILEEIYLRNYYEELNDLIFFTEWCYIIDLDNQTFEIYKGNNIKPVPKEERFYNLNKNSKYFNNKIYPVKLIKKYFFDKLPNNKQFLLDLGFEVE